jgi:hypothetical protein
LITCAWYISPVTTHLLPYAGNPSVFHRLVKRLPVKPAFLRKKTAGKPSIREKRGGIV